jgi:PAS domain S-box-containing protein
MLTQLKNFLAPPVFADEEQTRQARLLHFTLVLSLAAIVTTTFVFILFVDGLRLNTLAGVVLGALLWVLLRFAQRGHTRAIGWLMGGALLLGLTLGAWGAQGVRSASVPAYFVALIMSSLVLGQRAAIVFGGLTVLAMWGLYFAELGGVMPMQLLSPTDASTRLVVIFTLITIVITALLRSATRSLTLGFRRARERAAELGVVNAELEAKVQARTAALQAANLWLQNELRERQRIEATLRASEEKFSMVFRASPIGMGITRLSDNRLTEVNDAFTAISGYARDEALGRTALELQLYPNAAIRAQAMTLLRTQGFLRDFEVSFQRKTGQSGAVLVSAELIELHGEPHSLFSVHDITARKQAEAALRESEERLRLALAAARMGTWDWDMSSGKITWSDQIPAIIGHPLDELTSTYDTYLNLISAQDRAGVMRVVAELPNNQLTELTFEHRIAWLDGSLHWLEGKAQIYRDELGKPVRMRGTLTDISARKQAEEILRASEEKFNKAFRSSPVGIVISRAADGRYLEVNDAFCAMTGYDRIEMIGRTSLELGVWTVEARERALALLAAQGVLREHEVQFCKKSGELGIVLLSVELIELSGERCLIISHHDITARKHAEEALRASEEKFAKAFHASPLPMTITRLSDYQWLEVNDAFVALSGYTRDEVIGRRAASALELWVNPAERARYLELLATQGFVRNFEATFRKKSGELAVALLAAERIELDGEPCLLASLQDITARKRAEDALRTSEEKFHKVFHASPIGITLSRFSDGRYLEVNDTYVALTGYERHTLIGHSATELGVWAKPEERTQLLAQLATQGFVRDYEASFRKQSGELGLVALAVESITVNGEQCILVATQDITARKQAEDTLRRYTTRLEILREIDSAILTARSSSEIAAAALQGLQQLVPCLRMSVLLLDLQVQQAFVLAVSVNGAPQLGAGVYVPLTSISRAAIETLRQGQSQVVSDLWALPERSLLDEQLLLEGVRSRLGVPLLFRGELIGMLVLSAGEPDAFNANHVEMATEVANQLAIAIQQARLYAETSEALRREQQLNEVAHTISSTLDLPTLLRQVVRLAVELVGAGESSMAVLSPNGEMFAYTFNYRAEVSPQTVPKGTGLAWDIVAIGKPILLADYKMHPKALPAWVNAGVQAFLGVPLIAGETVLGVLGLFHMTPEHHFTERDLALAEAIGRQAGIAIQNAQLYAETTEALSREQRLNEIARTISSTLDQAALLEKIVRLAAELIGVETSTIGLLDAAGETLSFLYAHNSPFGLNLRLRPRGQGIGWQVIDRGVSVVVNDYPQHPLALPDWVAAGAQSFAGVPIRAGETALGVLGLFYMSAGRQFSERDVALAESIGQQAGIAIQNAQLYAETTEALQREQRLNEVARTISSSLDQAALLENIARLASELLGADSSTLGLLSADRQTLTFSYGHNRPAGVPFRSMRRGEGSSWPVIDTGMPVVVNDYATHPQAVSVWVAAGAQSLMSVPIRAGETILGLLGFFYLRQGHRFTARDVALAEALGQQAGIAIQNARLFAETQQRAEELALINRLSQAAASQLKLEALIELVGENVRQIFNAHSVYVALYERAQNVLRFLYDFDQGRRLERVTLPLGDTLASRMIESRQALLINESFAERFAAMGLTMRGTPPQSYLGVPMLVGDPSAPSSPKGDINTLSGQAVIGVISVQNTEQEHAFTDAAVRLLTTIAAHVGVAIQNAQLFEATQRQLTELTVLQAVATVGAAVESEDDLLTYATPIISHAFFQEQCGVLLLDESRSGLYVHPSSRGAGAEHMQDLVPLGQGITGTVAASGQLMRVSDVRLEPVYRASTPETLSELCVPLKGSSQVLGVINVESPILNAFSEADERLLVAVAGQLATALERLRAEQALRRLNAELERRVALLTALHENGLDLSTQLDLSELLHTIVERLMRLEGVTMSVLYLAEPQCARLKLVVSHGLAPAHLVSYLNEGQGVAGQVFQRGELLVVPDYSQWPERVIDESELPYRSVLGMPIKWRGQVLGVINLLDERVGRFGQPEIEMAHLFADQAAAAILNAQLFEATRRQLAELTVLQAVALAGTESETEASLLERVMLTIGDTLFHGRGSIMLLDPSAGVLRMAAAARAVSEESKRYVVPLGHGITGTVAQRGQPWRVPDVRQEPTYVAGGAVTLSELCVPLKVGERVLGVINIESAQLDAFSEADERLLLTLAGQLAPAIERLRAEAALRQLNAELEQRVQERTAQLEAANKELEAFSYSVSHDLRSPLRSIDGFSQALLEDYEDQLNADGQDYLRRVRAATQRMGQLIDDLLNLSRITRAELHQELVDLSALAQVVVAELQHAEPQRAVEVVIAADLHGQGDARLLQIVLANLLGNAWKFTSKQAQARIELGAVVRDGHTTYFVRDNGAGFDMAYVSKLFGAFQRLHAMTEYSGTGIGLAIVQRIIHRHGGHVWAEGAVGQGATFYFTLTESNITGANHGRQNYFAG